MGGEHQALPAPDSTRLRQQVAMTPLLLADAILRAGAADRTVVCASLRDVRITTRGESVAAPSSWPLSQAGFPNLEKVEVIKFEPGIFFISCATPKGFRATSWTRAHRLPPIRRPRQTNLQARDAATKD